MGPLNTIFSTLNSLITTYLADFSIVPTYGTTGRERAQGGIWPRVSWVPTTEDIQPSRGQGGDSVRDSAGNMNLPGGAAPPIMTRVCNVECDLWGETRDPVETMINAVSSAVYDSMNGSFGILSARWLSPEEITKNGEVYRMIFQFSIPIVRVSPQTTVATPTSFPMTPQILPLVAS